MGIFRRKQSPAQAGLAQAAAIGDFWAWWQAEGSAATAAALEDRDPGRMVPALSQRVQAIHPGLAWELARGTDSEHVLVVCAKGDPQVRALAGRWCQAAPPEDLTWSFASSRPPAADPAGMVLQIGDVAIDVAAASAWAQVSGATIDVAIYHPSFPAMPEKVRQLAAFLLLDTVLGEATVETWIGSVDVASTSPMDAVPLIGLRSVVRDLRARFTDADGDPHWVLMEGATPAGERVLASTQIPLRAAIAPHLDTHLAVRVPYTDLTGEGLPGPASLGALRSLEEHLSARLGGGSGRIVAHETCQGLRTFHLYVDGTTPAAEQIRVAARGWDQGPVNLVAVPDPGWQRVAHLRT